MSTTAPPRLTITHLDGTIQPVYRSVVACPACNGEGQYEVALYTPPHATEPRTGEVPCEVCGTEDTRGTGYLPVLRCAATNLPLAQAEIEHATATDAEFEAALAQVDPDESLLWQYHHHLSARDRATIQWAEYDPEAIGQANDAIAAVQRAAVTMLAAGADLKRHGMSNGAPGIHQVPGGILLHLATGTPVLWKRPNAPAYAQPYRASADMRMATADGTKHVTLFGTTLPGDHYGWATDAGLATTYQES